MRGSTQLHNRGWRRLGIDRMHINGNALFRFDSLAFRQFLREARLNNPRVFDYSIHEHRWNEGDLTFNRDQMEWHIQMTVSVMHRFAYTSLVRVV